MGQPVVHFEVVGKDAEKLHEFYGDMFGWQVDAGNPMKYGMISREQNVGSDGVGIGGGIGPGPEGYPGHVTFYVAVPDVEESLQKAEQLGGTRVMGPDKPMDMVTIGLFTDPEGHTIGLVQQADL
jgi:predicted enzyme related to lactoylglutathione lyase